VTDFDACRITQPDVPVSPSDGLTPATRHKGPISTLQRISDKNVSSWTARARKAAPTTSVIQQAQRRNWFLTANLRLSGASLEGAPN